ncbi:MAG: acylphosphatase [Paucimonas sp.]|nr:acylphosphatase [Paucimonas sp.]
MSAVRLLVTGMVQGVSYRAAFSRMATQLGLDGWVRNRRDGAVEALVSGDAAAITRLVEWARRGPPAARVDDVVVSEEEIAVGPGFRIEVDG